MTTYRSIGATEVEVDAPLTQQLMQALVDNVLAIQEGDSTSPVIQHLALQGHRDAITAGDNVIFHDYIMADAVTSGVNLTTIKAKIRRAGTYRISIFVKSYGAGTSDDDSIHELRHHPSGGSDAQITSGLTKDTIAGTANIISNRLAVDDNTAATMQVDKSLAVGDLVYAKMQTLQGNNLPVYVKFQISVSDDDAIYGVDVTPQRKTTL